MSINFPNSPTNGSTYTHTDTGNIYSFLKSGTDEGYWRITTPGTVGIASSSEINAATDTLKYITPATLDGSTEWTKLKTCETGSTADQTDTELLTGVLAVGKATAAHINAGTETSKFITPDQLNVSTQWTKLKTCETGSTGDQTAAELLASIKTVDVNGPGGLNAGRLDGLSLSYSNDGDSVAGRDGAGDLTVRLIRPEYAGLNGAIGYIQTQVDIGVGNDNYVRPATPAQVRLSMGGSLGVGMTWKWVTKVANTTYTNSTGYPMYVGVLSQQISGNETYLLVNGVRAGHFSVAYIVSTGYVGAVVPAGNTYIWVGSNNLTAFTELSV